MKAHTKKKQGNIAQQLRAFAAETAKLQKPGAEPLTEVLARWVGAHLALAAQKASKEADGAGIPSALLRDLTADVVSLRKGDHSAERLRIEKEWLAIERKKTREFMEKEFKEWAKDPKNQDLLLELVLGKRLTPEEKARKINEIFGIEEPGGLSEEALKKIKHAAGLL